MIRQIATTLDRSDSVLADFLGTAALAILLIGSLHIPVFV